MNQISKNLRAAAPCVLSVVAPCFNEEDVIDQTHARLAEPEPEPERAPAAALARRR